MKETTGSGEKVEIKREDAVLNAMMTYCDEPCRICGETITKADLDDLCFVGYSKCNKARAAHQKCWREHPPEIRNQPGKDWVYQ